MCACVHVGVSPCHIDHKWACAYYVIRSCTCLNAPADRANHVIAWLLVTWSLDHWPSDRASVDHEIQQSLITWLGSKCHRISSMCSSTRTGSILFTIFPVEKSKLIPTHYSGGIPSESALCTSVKILVLSSLPVSRQVALIYTGCSHSFNLAPLLYSSFVFRTINIIQGKVCSWTTTM